MTLFIALVLVLLAVESICCVMILLYQPRVLVSMKKVVQARLIHDYGRAGEESFSVGVDWVQYSLSCCGVVSPADYQNSQVESWRQQTNTTHHRLQVPLTCCSLLNKGVRHNTLTLLLLPLLLLLLLHLYTLGPSLCVDVEAFQVGVFCNQQDSCPV